MAGPSATATDNAYSGNPRLALRLPSIGSITTRQRPPAPIRTLADLLGHGGEPLAFAGDGCEHRQRRILGRLVDRYGQIAAGAAPELVGPASPRHVGDGRSHGIAHRATDLEPALGGHGSNGSSWWKAMPSRIFGKKNVDLGGIV